MSINYRLSFLLGILILCLFLICALFVGESQLPNSGYSLFELSKTIFSDQFYEFNTWRTYNSDIKSLSFPFGFPILLALVGEIFGYRPMNSIYLNCFIAFLTWISLYRLCTYNLKLPNIFAISISISLILNQFYAQQLFSGNTIPTAILLLVLSGNLLQKSYLLSGLLIGFSALIRFDCILYGAVLIAFILFLDNRKILSLGKPEMLSLFLGFFIGLSPWICFSILNFGRIWASDNSWVVLSATYSYVNDFPAYSDKTLFTNPLMWSLRVTNNILPFVLMFLKTLIRSPITLWSLVMNILFWKQINRKLRLIYIVGLLLITLNSLPYITTGYYFIQRYYTPPILAICILSIWSINEFKDINKFKFLKLSLIVSISLTLVLSFKYLGQLSLDGVNHSRSINRELELINSLSKCHMKESKVTYIFDRKSDLNINLFRYGAITGMKTAILPRNWKELTEAQKTEYFLKMDPYKVINKQYTGGCL